MDVGSVDKLLLRGRALIKAILNSYFLCVLSHKTPPTTPFVFSSNDRRDCYDTTCKYFRRPRDHEIWFMGCTMGSGLFLDNSQ